MLEIEVKVPVADIAKVFDALNDSGAEFLGEKIQEDIYFAHPSRNFGITDEALRLRKDGPKEVLTYKGPKIDKRSKTREEIEFAVPFDEMGKVLTKLGFKEFIRIVKKRREYCLDDVIVCFDEVEGLGNFVELEYKGEDLKKGLQTIDAVKSKLGIEGNETRSYLELLLLKKKD